MDAIKSRYTELNERFKALDSSNKPLGPPLGRPSKLPALVAAAKAAIDSGNVIAAKQALVEVEEALEEGVRKEKAQVITIVEREPERRLYIDDRTYLGQLLRRHLQG